MATMTNAVFSDLYTSTCAHLQQVINPHVLEVLENTPLAEKVTLNLSGGSGARREQRLDDSDALVLSKCLRGLRCVTGLDVSYNNITGEGVRQLAHLLQEESTLRCLDLRFNQCPEGGAAALATSLQGNSSLVSLRLSGNKIGDSGGVQLAMMLQANDSLMELELCACHLGIQSIITFAVALKSNRSLRCVDFSQSLLISHQEEWLVHVSDMLQVNSSLLELRLGMAGVTDAGVDSLAEGLQLNRGLRYLDLRCNSVSSDGALRLAEVLKKNSTLEVLDLSWNRIQDQGALRLSEALTSAGCCLRALSVRSNSIRTDGLLSLAKAVEVSPTLTDVNIWGNHLEEPVCQAFQHLISSGRLAPDGTDVTPYETDGRAFLAEAPNSLRKHRPCITPPHTHTQDK